ncbi:MAG TPA: TlpA disulfide reductase family protein, partial [Gemmatimonadales bacterium]|nr:TlpA disulfide reductase family protein [Gemmatimonadales bacterium]
QGPRVGEQAPDIVLKTREGTRARLADLRGQAVVVNFWASWCAPCRSEIPDLMAVYEEHAARGLAVLAVNLTDQERRDDIVRFVEATGMPFPVLLDERGTVRERYGLTAVPTTVFIDRSGVVRGIHPGPISRQALEDGLETILGPDPDR